MPRRLSCVRPCGVSFSPPLPAGGPGRRLLLATLAAFAVVRHLPRANPRGTISLGRQAQQLIKVDRGGHELRLQDAVPLVSGDKLWIECDLPAGWFASAFWFDTEGRLTELAPLKITRGDRVDRLSYPPHDAVTVEGPPGTEFILVCAGRDRRWAGTRSPHSCRWAPLCPSFPIPPSCGSTAKK